MDPDLSNKPNKDSNNNPGLGLAFVSALFYTAYDVGVRSLLGTQTVWGMLFIRGCLGLILMSLMAKYLGRSLWTVKHLKILLFIGFFGFSSSVCSAIALSNIPLYQALMILYFYPVFTLLLAVPINGEKISRRDLCLTILAFSGGLTLLWPDETVGLDFRLHHMIGIAGAFLYSLAQVFIRRMGNDNNGLEPIFFYSIFAFCFALPLAWIFSFNHGLSNFKILGSGLILASLGIMAQLTSYAALRWLAGFKVGIIGYLELFLGGVISWLVFYDPMNLRSIVGGIVVIIVVFKLRITKSTSEHRNTTAIRKIN